MTTLLCCVPKRLPRSLKCDGCLARCSQQWDNEPPAQFPARVVHGEGAAGNACATSTASIGLPASPCASRADGPASCAGDGAPRGCCDGGGGPQGTTSDHGHDACTSCLGAACRALALLAQDINGSTILWRRGSWLDVGGEVDQVKCASVRACCVRAVAKVDSNNMVEEDSHLARVPSRINPQ